MRVLTPKEVRTLLSIMDDFQAGRIELPHEIIEINRRIDQAKRNALQFIIIFRMVDMSLVYEAVALMFEKDRLYGEWVKSETP